MSPKQKIFWQDKVISPGRKLVVTEENLDAWIAAHYGISSLDKIPLVRPQNMPKPVYDKLKKHIHKVKERQSRND